MSVALDVQYAGMNNGSNVQVWTILNNRAQLFTVRYNSDDTVRILAAYTGKSVDVNGGNIRNGTNVQQWTNNDTRAQKWVLGATGNTVTFRDIEYPTYKIQIAADTNFVLEIADRDAAAGKNVLLWSDENLTDQHWFFVPRPPLASGGVYELHSMLNTNYVAAIGSSSKSDMAGAIVWPTSGINDQKFVLIEESESENKWRIRNVNSGKYLDIKGNEARNNALVVQWGEPQNVRHQQWKILIRDTHTHTYKGVECPVISLGAYGNTSDGNMYMMHVASASNANSIDILADEGTNAFRWLLYPTEATDPFIPIPANLALSEEKGGSAIGTKAPTGSAYATWTCTQSWTNSGPNHYQWRMRKRYMSSRNSTWQEWSDYTAWETANYLQTGQSAWLADAIDGSYSIDSYKNLQVQFQVRCVGVDETSNLVGETATQDFYFIFQPTFTFDGAGISPAGLTVGYSNDYPYGMSTLYIDKVLVDGENILTETVVADSLDSTGSFTIPAESMTRLVPDGSTVEIVYRAATDQASAGDSKEATVGADEDAGKVLDAEPKLRSGSGRTIVATLPYPNARMWLKTPDGIVELENQGGSLGDAYACGEVVETQDAIGRMTSLHIDGKSVQDGTPSPSSPVPIESVEPTSGTSISIVGAETVPIDLQGNAARSIGDVRDSLDVVDGRLVLTKRVNKINLGLLSEYSGTFTGVRLDDGSYRFTISRTPFNTIYGADAFPSRDGTAGHLYGAVACSHLPTNGTSYSTWTAGPAIAGWRDNTAAFIIAVSADVTDSDQLKAWLAATQPTALYPLAEPQTIDLGTIDLPYCTDTAYVDAMVQPNICVGWKTDNITAGGDEASCFTVPYPFGSDFTIFTSAEDGDDWGTNSLEVMSTNPLLKDPCHAWSWDGGQFLLEASNDNLVTERTLKPVYETNALNARERESVSFAKTIGGEFSAKGMLIDNVTESTVEQLIALTKAQHVFYRAPSGETADVAIVGVSYTSHPEHSFVQVDMVEETV